MKSILDVSNIVFGGHYGSPNYRISGFPVGGIRKLMGIINANIRQSDFALCFDGGNTIKKELLPTYKAGRVPNYSVIAQIDLLREILLDCGIPFSLYDDMEADDCICSLVRLFAMVRDLDDVVIYSDDRDISCCVGERVRLRNATTNGICIDKSNYIYRVVNGETIPYNTILLHKMVYGDRSDNYSGLTLPGLRFDEFAQEYLNQVQPLVDDGSLPEAAYMDLDIMNVVIDSLPDHYSAEMKSALKAQAKIVFPQLRDVTTSGLSALVADYQTSGEQIYQVEKRHTCLFGYGDFDRQKFDFYCNVLNLNKCHLDRLSASQLERVDAFKEKLAMRSKALASGAMAVERYRSRKTVPASGTVVQNMELPL